MNEEKNPLNYENSANNIELPKAAQPEPKVVAPTPTPVNNSKDNSQPAASTPKFINQNQSPVVNKQPAPTPVQTSPQAQQPQNQPKVIVDIPEIPKLENETIGTIKKDKQKSPIAMLILFIILISAIYFIPQITPYFSNILSYLKISNNYEIYKGEMSASPTPTEDPVNTDTTLYDLSQSTTATINNVTIKSLSKNTESSKYYLNFEIANNNSETLDLMKEKIYLDIYDATNTYLDGILITAEPLEANQSMPISAPISEDIYNNGTKFEIIKRTYDDYPAIIMQTNILNCQKDNELITYNFNAQKLATLEYKLNYIKTDDETLTKDYIAYKTKIETLDAINGVSASLIQLTTGFTTDVIIDYSKIESNDLSSYDYRYYAKDTFAKNIKYEMMSRGYTCE